MTDGPETPRRSPGISRRQFLGATNLFAIGALAGCSESRETVEVETSLTVINTETDARTTLLDDDRGTLEQGEYFYWEFTLNGMRDVSYTVDVLEDGSVNTYVLEPEAFDTFREDEEGFRAMSNSIVKETSSAQTTFTLEGGDYYLIVINADILPENA